LQYSIRVHEHATSVARSPPAVSSAHGRLTPQPAQPPTAASFTVVADGGMNPPVGGLDERDHQVAGVEVQRICSARAERCVFSRENMGVFDPLGVSQVLDLH
jgi:hypothetical protein